MTREFQLINGRHTHGRIGSVEKIFKVFEDDATAQSLADEDVEVLYKRNRREMIEPNLWQASSGHGFGLIFIGSRGGGNIDAARLKTLFRRGG